MKIVCATNMPYVEEAFRTLGDPVVIEGRRIGPGDVRDAELLAIRSTTRADRRLLEGSRVRFVGTATIGYDHLDLAYLEQAGIRWCYAPGCNANSVSEYVVAALLCLSRRMGFPLQGKTIGVVGVGNVGSRVVEKAAALGLRVLQNDPPKADASGDPVFVPLDRVLAESDIVTLHVPLTASGRHPTRRMAGAEFFNRLKPGAIFINAARGGVTDSDALLWAMESGIVSAAVIDTWEGEPVIRRDVLERAAIATPHIAGHSFEGKVNGTVMVYREACRFLRQPAPWTPEGLLPPPLVPQVTVEAAGRQMEDVLWDAVRPVYDIAADDRRLRESQSGGPDARGAEFDRLRAEYPMRREFMFTRVALRHGTPELAGRLAQLKFQVTA